MLHPRPIRPQHSEPTTSRVRPTKRPRRTQNSARPPSGAPQSDISPSIKGTDKDKISTASFERFVAKRMISGAEAPPELKALARELHICASGLHTVPESHKDTLAASSYEETRLSATDLNFMFVDETVRAALRPCPTVEKIEQVIRQTRCAEKSGHSEASWNGSVHDHTFRLAFDNSRFESNVSFINCSTAKIEPQDLLPEDGAGESMQPRMVDFAIVLSRKQRSVAAWHRLRAFYPESQPTWNHTLHEPLKQAPIVVSVESTEPGTEKKDAIQQLGTCVTAQYRKLEQLVPSEQARERLPFLPLILIQGSKWLFLAATRKKDKTYLWEGVHIGSTSNPRQMYTLIACLQRLGRWALEVYEPWFDAHVVDRLLQE